MAIVNSYVSHYQRGILYIYPLFIHGCWLSSIIDHYFTIINHWVHVLITDSPTLLFRRSRMGKIDEVN